MKNIETDIIINASKEKVWGILTNFENYKSWNPFIISSIGKAIVNTKLENTILLDGKKQVFKPEVLEVEKNIKLRWLGVFLFKGFFAGEHYFIIEEINNNKVKLTQGENFSGLFSGILLNFIEENTIKGFKAMNISLKTEAEKN